MNTDILKTKPTLFMPTFRGRDRSHGMTAVVVVGCGGTGGRIIPNLAQHIANHNNEIESVANNNSYIKHKLSLMLIDMDTVEAKNLKRQNFFAFDIGKNKAAVLAERYSALYGLEISYFDKVFSECNLKQKANHHGWSEANYIIFDCTDNVTARKSIEECKLNGNGIIISCGNEDTYGQVLISTKADAYSYLRLANEAYAEIDGRKEINKANGKFNYDKLPRLTELFVNFKDTEKASCTEMTLQNDQSMPINMLVAQLAYNAFYDIVSGKGLNYHLVKCNINNTFSTSYISKNEDLIVVLTQAIFGIVNDDSLKLMEELSTNYKEYIDLDGEDLIEKIKDKGPLRHGIINAYLSVHGSRYRKPGHNEVVKLLNPAKEELIKYLEGN